MIDMVVLTDTTVRAINIAVLSFCSLELVILLLAFPRIRLKVPASRIFYTKMLVSTGTILCYAASLMGASSNLSVLAIAMRSVAYVGIYAVYVLYIMYLREHINEVGPDKKITRWIIYVSAIVGIIGALIWILSMFRGGISEMTNFRMATGRLYVIEHISDFILVLIALLILINYRRTLGRRETLVLLAMPILVTLTALFEPLSQGIELRYPGLMLQFLIVYTQHHMEVEARRELGETEGLRQRLRMATGRMKPHYLYNVLTTIYYLVETDPSRAQHAIGTFSEYLRSTLEAMEKQELVSFSWELEEIRNYLVLEKIRFGDKLNVIYDIEYDDFMLPPLTILPLVENAVKHGIGSKEEGGTIRIISRKLSGGGAQIRIKDDGIGFDVNSIDERDTTDEGIANVRERIRLEIGGDLNITSAPGKGTTAMVTLRPESKL